MSSEWGSVVNNLVDTCVCGDLNDLQAVTKERAIDAKGKSHWSIAFSTSRGLSGEIKVYKPNYICISWQTTGSGSPVAASKVCLSEFEAKEVLMRFIQ